MKYFLIMALALVISPTMAEVPKDATAMNLTATARQTVTPDTLHAVLRIEHKAKTPQKVQHYVNDHMQKAVKYAEGEQGIKIITGGYRVNERWINQNDPRKSRQKVWQGNQALTLKGKNSEQILQVVGELQKNGFAMNSLTYQLSQNVADTFKDNLMAEAMEDLKRQANLFAKQLGKRKVHFARINMNGGGYRPQRVNYQAESMMSDGPNSGAKGMSAPVARAGDADITVTISAEVWLR